MSKFKDTLITILLSMAAGIGTLLFILWKFTTAGRNEKNAKTFLKEAPDALQEEVLKGLEVKETEFHKKANAIKKEIENAKKEEIIYAFEKAFGVGSHHTHVYTDPSSGSSDRDSSP